MSKIWIVFSFDDYYPLGGGEDVLGVFSSEESADDFIKSSPLAKTHDNVTKNSFVVESV